MIKDDNSDLRVGVYLNGSQDFEKLDLSFINLKFVQIDSEEFELFYNQIDTSPKRPNSLQSYFDDLRNQDLGYLIYLAIPIKIDRPIDFEVFYEILHPILLLAPSEFNLIRIVTYQKFEMMKVSTIV